MAHENQRVKPDTHLSGIELGDLIDNESAAFEILGQLVKQKQNNDLSLKWNGIDIPADALIAYDKNGKEAYALAQQYAEKLSEKYRANKDSQKGVVKCDSFDELTGQEGSGKHIITKARDHYKNSKEHYDYHGMKIPQHAIIEYRHGKTVALGFAQDWAFTIAEKYKEISSQKKPEDAWEQKKLAEVMGSVALSRKVLQGLRDLPDNNSTFHIFGLDIPKSALVNYKHLGRDAYGITCEWGLKVEKNCKESLRTKRIKPRVSPAHQTQEERCTKNNDGISLC